MRRRWIAAGLLFLCVGCNRQDAECLGRIGNLAVQRLGKLKPTAGGDSGLGRALPGYGAGPDEKVDAEPKDK